MRIRVRVEQQASDLRVFVGPTEVTSLLDVNIPFDAGRYLILAMRPGYSVFHRELDLKSKQVASVDVVLEREPALRPAVSQRSARGSTAGKVMLGTGAGLVAFGLVAGWRWYVNDHPVNVADAQANDRARLWLATSAISLLMGSVDAGIGVGLQLRARRSRAVHVTPIAGSSAAALAASGVF